MTTPRPLARPLALSLALAAGLLLGGCDDRGPIGEAISDATEKLGALSPGGGGTASAKYPHEVYQQVESSLQKEAGKGTPTQNASAYILLSRAQAGIAATPAAQAAEGERTIQHLQTQIRAALDQWQTLSAHAAALSAYDPAEELNEIARQSQERESAITREQARKTDIDARVADLRNQAASKATAAKAKRGEEGQILQGMAQASAVDAEALLRQAVAIRRQADALDNESADLEARAAQVAPQSDQVQLEIDRVRAHRTLLDQNRDEVTARAAAMKQRADEAQAAASEAAAAVAELVGQMESARAALSYEDAAGHYEKAAASAKKAVAADAAGRGSAELAHGVAQQSLGDLRLAQAHGLARAAATYDALAGVTPALPDSANYRGTLATLQEGQKSALEAATAAYSAAAQSYKGAGGAAGARERLDAVVMGLARTVKTTSGGTKDLAVELGLSDAPPEPEAGEDPAPAPESTAQAGTPQATIEALITAIKAGDFPTILGYLYADGPPLTTVLESAGRVAASATQLHEAMKAKFGVGLEALSQGAPQGMAPNFDTSQFENLTAADFPVEVNGETAIVRSPPALEGPNDGLAMRRVDGVWKVDLDAMLAGTGENPQQAQQAQMMVGMMAPVIPQLGAIFDDLRAGVEDGTYADAAAVAQAFNQRMGQIMGALMGGGMPPPPPPPGGG